MPNEKPTGHGPGHHNIRIHDPEEHVVNRTGWLRAAVLGANDGILSTASLIVGVAAAGTGKTEILVAGLAGLVAGAMSMAAGEYVSVSSQADAEAGDMARERTELANNPEGELMELSLIYQGRGLDPELALQVAKQLTAHDALGAHMRDELGLNELTAAQPLQAAVVSAITFAAGASVPLVMAFVAPLAMMLPAVVLATLVALVALGALGAAAGRAGRRKAALRVTFWGAIAMAATILVGKMVGLSI